MTFGSPDSPSYAYHARHTAESSVTEPRLGEAIGRLRTHVTRFLSEQRRFDQVFQDWQTNCLDHLEQLGQQIAELRGRSEFGTATREHGGRPETRVRLALVSQCGEHI